MQYPVFSYFAHLLRMLCITTVFFSMQGCAKPLPWQETNHKQAIKPFLEQTFQEPVEVLSSTAVAYSWSDTEKSRYYQGYFSTPSLDYRKARMNYYYHDSVRKLKTDYWTQKAGWLADQAIESGIDNVTFTIWIQPNNSIPDVQITPQEKADFEQLKRKIFQDGAFQISVMVSAPDLKTNRKKYLQFHIDLMRELKAQHIKKSSLFIQFFDGEVDISKVRIHPQSVVSGKLNDHMIERWSSIHNNKWYDLVKDHPDKVLKYGKVFTYR